MPKAKLDVVYAAPREHAVLVNVPDAAFLMLDGRGSPHGPAFQGAIHTLYAVGFAVGRMLKERGLARAASLPPLEALWWWSGDDYPAAPAREKEWRWRLMLRQPPEATREVVLAAIAHVRDRHPELAVDLVEHRHFAEGECMQITHVGPYRSEGPTLERLHADVKAAGFEMAGFHHEVYLSDPRRAKPNTLRTLLRQPVRRVPARQALAPQT